MRKIPLRFKIATAIVVSIGLIWTMTPILWIVMTSFKERAEQMNIPPTLFPKRWTVQNYAEFFKRADFIRSFSNSILVTVSSTAISLMLALPGAYALARFKFRFKNLFAFLILLARMTPPVVMVVPFFLIARFLELNRTYFPIIIASSFLSVPFALWMMRGFFAEVPGSLEEAALIDGCTRSQAIRKVILPVIAPGLAATSILSALIAWNQFMFAVVLTNSSTRTLPVLVNMFVSERNIDWGAMSAAAVITALPMIIFALLVQNNLVRGLAAGSVKG
ncbi:carbohydrate ABC transporter permease [Pseudothermotoga sp.]|jgi:multiple sugar transport system permease protein|uniref:carbohydrate ABC transporter permease n=1 Tax=Pseudothermotoga sp. TaxID=2033661 RepID=UPI00258D59FC|nr:carbohydrate ABC transporter permease [Pseudothermotoga sp.]MDK2884606.1 multiple sugar transport system permease protein [Pseudothermotoga sp.]